MGYNKALLSKALEETKKRGEAARRTYEQQKKRVAEQFPRLRGIEQELMQLGPMLGLSAIAGYTERVKAIQEKCAALAKEREALYQKAGLAPYTPFCTACEDSGYTKDNKLCDCVKRRTKELSYASLSTEMPIKNCRFDNFFLDYYANEQDRAVMEKVVAFCKKYAAELSASSKSLLFFGGTGLGKTHLSLAIAAAGLERGLGVVYSPAQNIMQKLEKEHFSYSAETPLLDDVFSCDLLLLDDLGAEFSTSFSQSLIYNIINTRLLAGRPTVISTNLSLEELADRYTPRVASRILGCYAIKRFSGQDVRQQKRMEEIQKGKEQ